MPKMRLVRHSSRSGISLIRGSASVLRRGVSQICPVGGLIGEDGEAVIDINNASISKLPFLLCSSSA
jgi:hypothetical protein